MRNVVFFYRERVAWGVRVSLTAEAVLSRSTPEKGHPAAGRVWFDAGSVALSDLSIDYLRKGVHLVGNALNVALDGQYALISFDAVDFSLTDFQLEGLTAAMVMWLADEFDIQRPGLHVHFDRQQYRYVFEWDSISDPN